MKSLVLIAVLAFAPSVFAQDDEGVQYCSAEMIYADGTYRDFVRVECDSEFAGACLKEVPRANDDSAWEAVAEKECRAASAAADAQSSLRPL